MQADLYTALEDSLLGTRRALVNACRDLDIDIEDIDTHNLMCMQCSSCFVWHRSSNIIDDLDMNPICKYCEELMGL